MNYPNPFTPFTTIYHSLSGNSQVDIFVYNIQGQRVKTLGDDTIPRLKCTSSLRTQQSNPKIIFHFKRGIDMK